jgi:hypothetical protein
MRRQNRFRQMQLLIDEIGGVQEQPRGPDANRMKMRRRLGGALYRGLGFPAWAQRCGDVKCSRRSRPGTVNRASGAALKSRAAMSLRPITRRIATMIRLLTLLSAATFAVASATAFAQGTGKTADAPKATPATPATPAAAPKADDTKKASKQKANEPTKTQTRAGDPKGEAKGQSK